MSRNSLTCYTGRHLRIRRLVQFIFVGAVYYNALSNCAALLCRTQRRVAHMCSSNVSDPANRLRKTRKKKSSVAPLFRSGRRSLVCARLSNKGKVGVQRGRKTAGCPSSLPPPRARQRSRRPQTANPPLRFSEKLSARWGRTRLRQFAHPAQPVLKKLPPGQGEPPARFRCPNRPVQKKGDARTGRSAYAPRVHQKAGAAKKSAAHGHMSTHEDQIFLRFTL